MAVSMSDSSRKMRQYRARMKEKGLRAVQIWVPDVRSPDIAEALRRQSLLASSAPDEREMLDFLENVGAWGDAG
ncbi:antitoxin MazE family protein [Desulfovibrio sulfodismutans]|uniref:Antitoxin MazE family protein n=1 Tax=Desulfolutivibrio sulfodismutans TaxID=63561 RepID=A0A7K3NKU5_9BACT|nr:antitoxin MazE family protein [Desulfolutivibrio sulfodismutans]NDY56802.1 antitoxin MazE family protein [Desulfolutivibrio sulfodismutans]QLA10941.1 DUF3018 family protein [Desulfolutivibrio sulfodismutans DSM 3696]